jgi:VacB/RNase II family 3'-5' exoribonuclease
MVEHGLLPEFSPDVVAETLAIGGPAGFEGANIRDMRDRLWASIDNDTSRDLDQLSVAEAAAGGATKIFVAIADVDALVHASSAIDGHAKTNTTSVYTAARIFPMLPEKLSTDLTSLAESSDRRALVVEMLVQPNGMVTESDVYGAVVRNRAKLAYNSVAAWLDGTGPAPARVASVPGIDEQLRMQDRVAQALRSTRFEHGALDLQTPEATAVFEGDALRDLVPEEPNRAKELIEDFMIAANGVTARYLARKGFPSLRRVLRTPRRWDKIVAIAAEHGDSLPAQASCEALAKFLTKERGRDPARFPELSLSVVKLLGRGEYVLNPPGQKPVGHFGLAVSDYTHSTAPNRRFPDLLTQRLVKAAIASQPVPYDSGALEALAAHCTEQETEAAKVERQVMKSAAAQLLASRIGGQFDATVSGASEKGTWVRIQKPSAEGKLIRGAQGLDVGDPVHVELVSINVERGFIDFARTRR